MTLSPGTRFGRYEIRSQLGAGGMGEVYLAFDTELDRTVAIKILPADLASDPHRLQRFIQEAKAASALNHPHILTIYEVGTTDTTRFIATEFIDGETLRQRMRSGSLGLNEVLEIATQAASALAAAHAAGITHRDIKPENIMVRRDGYIKLLDFGLAKLTGPKGGTSDLEAPTRALVNTDAGTVMGTANYMSPEQAKGVAVDSRTDLWSLGAVLYEMVARHLPFAGETPTETISLILQREPTQLTRYAAGIPAELERIVTKALTKNPDERYQTAKDLAVDLRNLKRRLEVDAEIDRTVPPEFRSRASTSSGQNTQGTASGGMNATASASATYSASSAEYIFSGIKQHKLAAAIALIVLVVGAIGFTVYRHASGSEIAIESIAVLPFENQNRDPNVDWLSDGVTESIINNLAQLPNLRVSPRSTVFHYKGKQTDPLAVGKELGVRAVLSGRFLQTGDDVTISVELADVRDNKQLWGERFNRKVADALAMQQDISQQISERLRLQLSGPEQHQMMARRNTGNTEAYQLYLKGRYYWNKRTEEGSQKAIEFFQQAINKDPGYALAHVGLAESYLLSGLVAAERAAKAKAAAMNALAIDPTLGEAYATLGATAGTYDWNYLESEKAYRRAIELSPNYATAHHWYGEFLVTQGRFDEGFAEYKKALELDPLSLAIGSDLGIAYYFARQHDRAVEYLKKLIEMDPTYVRTHFYLSQVYLEKGMLAEGLAEREQGAILTGANREVMAQKKASILAALKTSGPRGYWQKVFEVTKEDREKDPIGTALIYAKLGDIDQAFAFLEKAYASRDPDLIMLKVEPGFDPLRPDPRFTDLMRRVGFLQ
ncbi:MAG: protein kinase domain-containing protein [Pyrinomonadaceae bacterium]